MSVPFFFFFNDTATTEIYTLSLHDALPIWVRHFSSPRLQGYSAMAPMSSLSRHNSFRVPDKPLVGSKTQRRWCGSLTPAISAIGRLRLRSDLARQTVINSIRNRHGIAV